MNYVVAGYVIALSSLFLYSVSVLVRRRRVRATFDRLHNETKESIR
jgi:hypothetical protein